MIEVYLVAAGVLFIAGIVAGILGLTVIGIHREERGYRTRSETRGKATRGARLVTGMHVLPRGTYEAVHYRHRQPPANRDWYRD